MRLAILNLRVSYSNSLERVIKILQNFLQDTPLILDDPPPEIQVAELGDIAIVLTLRFWVATENYSSVYWQVKRDVKTVLEQSGITIPHGKSITSFFEEKNT